MTSLDFKALLKQEKIRHLAELSVERDTAAESRSTRDAGNQAPKHGNLRRASFNGAGDITTVNSTNESSSSLREVVNGPILDMVNIRLPATRSIFYAPGFVSESQAQHILSRLYDTESGKGGIVHAGDSAWLALKSRRLQSWGGQPGEDFRQDPLPVWMENLCDALVARGAFPSEGRPNHVLINGNEHGEGNPTATMEMRLALEIAVSVDKIVQGPRSTALGALLIGHNVLAAAVREPRTIKDVEIVPNTGDAKCGYFPPIQEYMPGQGIMPHTDGPCYEPRTATLSLGGDAIMHFSPRVAAEDIGRAGVDTRVRESVVLRERCLVIFAEEAYSRMLHGIDAVAAETVGAKGAAVANGIVADAPDGTLIRRRLRVSLTFRRTAKVPCKASVS